MPALARMSHHVAFVALTCVSPQPTVCECRGGTRGGSASTRELRMKAHEGEKNEVHLSPRLAAPEAVIRKTVDMFTRQICCCSVTCDTDAAAETMNALARCAPCQFFCSLQARNQLARGWVPCQDLPNRERRVNQKGPAFMRDLGARRNVAVTSQDQVDVGFDLVALNVRDPGDGNRPADFASVKVAPQVVVDEIVPLRRAAR